MTKHAALTWLLHDLRRRQRRAGDNDDHETAARLVLRIEWVERLLKEAKRRGD